MKVEKIVANKMYTLVEIKNNGDSQSALKIYKQTIMPLLYSDFLVLLLLVAITRCSV